METIGSIIYLKEGSQKLMIINRGPIVEIENQSIYLTIQHVNIRLVLWKMKFIILTRKI
ncbi:Putative EsaC protein analog (Listeria type 3) [Staphylococcus aureus]|nr:Putative EsaC protein analog (Listeria type 3) [Staphylococcus aureus]